MKRLAFLTTSLIVALLSFGGASALAEESEETYYPADAQFTKVLDFPELCDYCIDGDTYYFAEGNTINVFDGTHLTSYVHSAPVTAVDFDGEVYFGDGESVYVLTEENGGYTAVPSETERIFTGNAVLTVADGIYRLNQGRLDYCANDQSSFSVIEGDYSKLKLYNQSVYAMSGSCLYEISGDTAKELSFEFFYDCANADGVKVGQTSSKLRNYTLKFVTVKAGAYMTEVDLSSIETENFTLGKTLRAEESVALLLCYTGNAAIISIGDDSYILNKESVTETEVNCYKESDYENATVIGNRIYASPYVIIGTSAVGDAAGTIVGVIHKLEYEGVLGSAFYEVVYMTESGTKVGYVADGFLTEYIIEDNKAPEIVPDPDYSEKNDTRTILLIFAVVVLVLIAIGYLAYAGTSDKRKKKKDKKQPDKDKE